MNPNPKTGKLLFVRQEVSHADLATVTGGLTIPKFIKKTVSKVARTSSALPITRVNIRYSR